MNGSFPLETSATARPAAATSEGDLIPERPSDPVASVVIPARNEARNLDFLIDEVSAALRDLAIEIVVVDDGSTDETAAVISTKKAVGTPIRHIRHQISRGQSAAVRSGLLASRAPVIVTLDGDGQNDPAYIPAFLTALAAGSPTVACVSGHRQGRTDSGGKRWASLFANRLRRALLKDRTEDSGCGLRAVRREVFLLLPFFDGWHRYIPALILREGYDIRSLDIVDRPRRHGRSNYGMVDRGLRGLLDLAGVWWLRRRFHGRADARELP